MARFCAVVGVNVHSEGSAGLLGSSTKVAGMDEPREVDLCVPPNPRLVLVAEATLVAAPQLVAGVVLQHSGNCFGKVWETRRVGANRDTAHHQRKEDIFAIFITAMT